MIGFPFILLGFTVGLMVTVGFLNRLSLGDFRGIVLGVGGGVSVWLSLVASYRIFLHIFPLTTGVIPANSPGETTFHVHSLFSVLFFSPLLRSWLVPVPLLRWLYIALGARIGERSYPSGLMSEPALVTIGRDCVLGQDSLLISHVMEGDRLALHPIRIGDNATIGARAILLPGVVVGAGAVVAAGAVVPKFSQITPRDVWGGVPARRLRTLSSDDETAGPGAALAAVACSE
jgi:acetyltransferase-like isoleucine patch superfamily enzyme